MIQSCNSTSLTMWGLGYDSHSGAYVFIVMTPLLNMLFRIHCFICVKLLYMVSPHGCVHKILYKMHRTEKKDVFVYIVVGQVKFDGL